MCTASSFAMIFRSDLLMEDAIVTRGSGVLGTLLDPSLVTDMTLIINLYKFDLKILLLNLVIQLVYRY